MIGVLRSNERLWELFTKKEEYQPLLLDQYQRFPYYLSKHRNVLEPEVSAFLIRNGFRVEYPDGKKFAICLTHDTDVVGFSRSTLVREMVRAMRERRVGMSLRILASKIKKRLSPVWNFEQIMSLEQKYGAKSSFYFLALDRDDQDFNFRIEELKKELKDIIDGGWEVGLHGGHKAFDDLNQIREEKERLENVTQKQVIGYRNHYLRFRVPTTWELLKTAGFKYDATFGYADCVGFRNGMCHPFRPFNLNTDDDIDILEIPLIVMDRTLSTYMQLDMKNAWEMVKRIIDTVERYRGVATILWHNTSMRGTGLEFYEQILKYCHERNAWMTSGESIWDWWMNRRGQAPDNHG
jgi:peptidoglycan/xylan/chitin deacetylase (PgdA/CDA1 family)